MKGTEIDQFEKKYGYKPTPLRTAVDALAVFVNKDNPIKCLTIAQVDAIFSKRRRAGDKEDVKTWGQLGLTGEWASRPISLYGRNSASGTYGFFKEHVAEERRLQGRGQGAARLGRGRPGGHRGPLRHGVQRHRLRDGRGAGRPDRREDRRPVRRGQRRERVRGSYPLARFLFVYMNKAPGKGLDPLTREFAKLALSKEGQEVVVKDGYFPIPASIAKEELNKVQ